MKRPPSAKDVRVGTRVLVGTPGRGAREHTVTAIEKRGRAEMFVLDDGSEFYRTTVTHFLSMKRWVILV